MACPALDTESAFVNALTLTRHYRISGDTLRLYARTDNAAGLVQGSEVWLGGLKVGVVRSVGLGELAGRPPDHVAFSAGVHAEFGLPVRADTPRPTSPITGSQQ